MSPARRSQSSSRSWLESFESGDSGLLKAWKVSSSGVFSNAFLQGPTKTIRIVTACSCADFSRGGNSFSVMNLEFKKSMLTSKIATLVAAMASLISCLQCCPASIFLSSQTSTDPAFSNWNRYVRRRERNFSSRWL